MIDAPYTILDLSANQGIVDFVALVSGGPKSPDAVYLKATEGETLTDSRFAANAEELSKAGIPFGAYHFLSALSDPKDQAAHFLETIGSCNGLCLPPMLDVERGAGATGKIPPAEYVSAWIDTVESQLGVTPVIYTGAWVAAANHLGSHPELKRCQLWVAAYTIRNPPLCPPWSLWGQDGGPIIWQYTGTGSWPGVHGHVDVSRAISLPDGKPR